jgi:hypothetical protein
MVSNHQIISFSGQFLFWKIKSHTVQGWKNMEVAACMGFRVWLRNVTKFETSALVHCHGGFASPLTTTFLVSCGILCHEDKTEIINNITYLLCDLLE